MKRNKRVNIPLAIKIIIAVSFTGLFLLVFVYYSPSLKRKRFESYLLEQYRIIARQTSGEEGNRLETDAPELAAYQDFLMTVDPETGTVPDERLVQARKVMLEKMEKKGIVEEPTWVNEPANMGGRTRALMFDPSDTLHIKLWAGAVTGGLWVNDDITNPLMSWHPVNDFLENLSISCLAYDPQHPEILYAGTGEPQTAVYIYRESSGLGSGILRSVDGGVTWTTLPSTSDFKYIVDLVTRVENDTTVLYAGVVSGTYKGVFHRSIPSDGVYRSVDGGTSWTQVLPGIPGTKEVYSPADLELGAGGRIFVGTYRNNIGKGGGRILYSDNGIDWNIYDSIALEIDTVSDVTSNIPGRVLITASPSDTNRVYAVIASGGYTEAGFIFYRAYAILRSDDGGTTWTKTAMPDESGTWAYLAWHALSLSVDPVDPDVLYAGGLDQHKSNDGGETWHVISDWMGMYTGEGGFAYIHADQHRLIFRNGRSDEIVVGTDGGIFYSSNGSQSYPDFYKRNTGYNTMQFYTCAVSPQAGSPDILAGTQDNGTIFYQGMAVSENNMISGGDGAYCFFDTDQPDNLITSVYYNRYYVYQYEEGVNPTLRQYIDNYYSGVFINPADYDSENNTLYANAVTYEGDLQDQLLRIDNILTVPSGKFLLLNTGTQVYFSAVKISPLHTDSHTTVYAGTQSGKLYRVDNAEDFPSVTEIGSSSFPTANISCIATGADEDHLLVTFSNYGVPSVWESKDGGGSWKSIEGDLPDMPVRWVIYHPALNRGALLATELGVWMCNNLDAASPVWTPVNNGLAKVRTDMLRYRLSDGLLVAATHGRGIYKSTSLGTGRRDLIQPEVNLTIYPNPADDFIHISGLPAGKFQVTVFDMSGKVIIQQQTTVKSESESFSMDMSYLTDGTYLISIVNQEVQTDNILIIKH